MHVDVYASVCTHVHMCMSWCVYTQSDQFSQMKSFQSVTVPVSTLLFGAPLV